METIDETTLTIHDDNKPIVTIEKEYFKLNHINKLEILLTVKNWVKDELDKIANG